MDKLVSIIVLNWQGLKHLNENLDSLLQQTYNNYELIFVDNGSTDGSQEYVKVHFPSVKLISLDKNYGFCKGNREGLTAAKGDYIVLLNNDTVVEPDWLKSLVLAAETYPEAGIFASKMLLYSDRQLIDSVGDGFSICGAGYKRGHLEQSDKFKEGCYVFGACAGAAMYKRELIEKIGFLDEDFFAIYEDIDLSFRAQLAGYKCRYVQDAVVYHKVNSTIGHLSDFYVYYGQRNAEYVYFKNMSTKLLLRSLPHHFAYNFLAFLYFLKKGKGIVFLKAKLGFIKDLKKVLEKRKQIQALKVVSDKYLWDLFEKKWLKSRLKGK